MNASICALEIALLDAFAKDQKMKIIDIFSHEYYASPIKYSAVIPLAAEDIVKNACMTINNLGINRLKLKMGKDLPQNQALLKIISETISSKYDLIVDVNGVWDKTTAIRHLPLLSEHGVKVIEQPMATESNDISDFSKVARGFNVTLMADESACTFEDIEKIVTSMTDDGAEFFGDIQTYPETGKKLVYFYGPDGIILEFAQYK